MPAIGRLWPSDNDDEDDNGDDNDDVGDCDDDDDDYGDADDDIVNAWLDQVYSSSTSGRATLLPRTPPPPPRGGGEVPKVGAGQGEEHGGGRQGQGGQGQGGQGQDGQGQDGEDVLGEALLATSRASDQFSEPAIVIAGIFCFLARLIRPLPQM